MRSSKVISAEMKRADELSKEIAKTRHGIVSLSVHGMVLGTLYTLAWVLGATDEAPVDYARRKLDGDDK
jgi:hypothetical protein